MAHKDYLHNHKEFLDLIRILANEIGVDPSLVEKDYWIMHTLYGLMSIPTNPATHSKVI